MARESRVDMKRLWQLAQEGKGADEIMKELDIAEIGILKNALQHLMTEKGRTVNVPGLIGKGSVAGEYTDTGTRVPPAMQDKK